MKLITANYTVCLLPTSQEAGVLGGRRNGGEAGGMAGKQGAWQGAWQGGRDIVKMAANDNATVNWKQLYTNYCMFTFIYLRFITF